MQKALPSRDLTASRLASAALARALRPRLTGYRFEILQFVDLCSVRQ
jgi:hypothetical protein